MQIHKKKIKKEDGRYLIYYTFIEEEKKGGARVLELRRNPMEQS